MIRLSATGVTRRFGDTQALSGVDLELEGGEIHGLLGENGAGKSTLAGILAGIQRPDAGRIALDGREVSNWSPAAALRNGVALVDQHDALVGPLTVAENLELGRLDGRPWISRRSLSRRVSECARETGIELPDADARVADLSLGERQRIDFVRALSVRPRVLILDEPTAVLVPSEAKRLLATLKTLRDRGVSVLFITHRLREVRAVCDRVTVLRGGRVVGRHRGEEIARADLAAEMVGASVAPRPGTRFERPAPGPVVLDVRDLAAGSERGVKGVSFAVRAGEVVGVAGVDGNGQAALLDVLAGIVRPRSGRVLVEGREPRFGTPGCTRAVGLSIIPADRQADGLALPLDVAENLHLSVASLREVGFPFRRTLVSRAAALIARFAIRADPWTRAGDLSGGNQQRVVLARELSSPTRVLVLANPTRGLDVRATLDVRGAISEAARRGAGVLLVSSDLDEVLELSDRVLVLFSGRIRGEFGPQDDRARIGRAMGGQIP